MSDKHDSKQKLLRNKAHHESLAMIAKHERTPSGIESEIKDAAGNVQEELSKIRASANHAHQG